MGKWAKITPEEADAIAPAAEPVKKDVWNQYIEDVDSGKIKEGQVQPTAPKTSKWAKITPEEADALVQSAPIATPIEKPIVNPSAAPIPKLPVPERPTTNLVDTLSQPKTGVGIPTAPISSANQTGSNIPEFVKKPGPTSIPGKDILKPLPAPIPKQTVPRDNMLVRGLVADPAMANIKEVFSREDTPTTRIKDRALEGAAIGMGMRAPLWAASKVSPIFTNFLDKAAKMGPILEGSSAAGGAAAQVAAEQGASPEMQTAVDVGVSGAAGGVKTAGNLAKSALGISPAQIHKNLIPKVASAGARNIARDEAIAQRAAQGKPSFGQPSPVPSSVEEALVPGPSRTALAEARNKPLAGFKGKPIPTAEDEAAELAKANAESLWNQKKQIEDTLRGNKALSRAERTKLDQQRLDLHEQAKAADEAYSDAVVKAAGVKDQTLKGTTGSEIWKNAQAAGVLGLLTSPAHALPMAIANAAREPIFDWGAATTRNYVNRNPKSLEDAFKYGAGKLPSPVAQAAVPAGAAIIQNKVSPGKATEPVMREEVDYEGSYGPGGDPNTPSIPVVPPAAEGYAQGGEVDDPYALSATVQRLLGMGIPREVIEQIIQGGKGALRGTILGASSLPSAGIDLISGNPQGTNQRGVEQGLEGLKPKGIVGETAERAGNLFGGASSMVLPFAGAPRIAGALAKGALTGSGTGALAGQATKELGGGQTAQTVAEIAGGSAPGIAKMIGNKVPSRIYENVTGTNPRTVAADVTDEFRNRRGINADIEQENMMTQLKGRGMTLPLKEQTTRVTEALQGPRKQSWEKAAITPGAKNTLPIEDIASTPRLRESGQFADKLDNTVKNRLAESHTNRDRLMSLGPLTENNSRHFNQVDLFNEDTLKKVDFLRNRNKGELGQLVTDKQAELAKVRPALLKELANAKNARNQNPEYIRQLEEAVHGNLPETRLVEGLGVPAGQVANPENYAKGGKVPNAAIELLAAPYGALRGTILGAAQGPSALIDLLKQQEIGTNQQGVEGGLNEILPKYDGALYDAGEMAGNVFGTASSGIGVSGGLGKIAQGLGKARQVERALGLGTKHMPGLAKQAQTGVDSALGTGAYSLYDNVVNKKRKLAQGGRVYNDDGMYSDDLKYNDDGKYQDDLKYAVPAVDPYATEQEDPLASSPTYQNLVQRGAPESVLSFLRQQLSPEAREEKRK